MARFASLFHNKLGTPAFVLDARVAANWLPSLTWSSYTRQLLGKMSAGTAAAPRGWPTELATILRGLERAGTVTEQAVSAFLTGLRSFRIGIDAGAPVRMWLDTLAFARAHNLSVSDAAYVELALRVGLPLATIDPALTAAATAAGVTTYTP